MNDKTKKIIIDGIKDEAKGNIGKALAAILVGSIVKIVKTLKNWEDELLYNNRTNYIRSLYQLVCNKLRTKMC